MPFDQAFLYMQWGGHFMNTGRRDSFSGALKLGQKTGAYSEGELPPLDASEYYGALRDSLVTFWRGAQNKIRSDARLTEVKFNRIGRDGKYQFPANPVAYSDLNTAGSGSPVYPQQVALATTYRTGNKRGRASRGRTYWPTCASFDAETGGVASGQASAFAASVAGWFQELSNISFSYGYALAPVVASDIGTGLTMPIKRVEVGSRFDIQRRRDNVEDEVFVGSNVPTPVVGGPGATGPESGWTYPGSWFLPLIIGSGGAIG